MKKKLVLFLCFAALTTATFSYELPNDNSKNQPIGVREAKLLELRKAGNLAELTEAAIQGNEIAHRMIAEGYELGAFGKVDYDKAMAWNKSALKLGEVRAYSNIGLMYYKGLGVKQDYKMAFDCLLKATELGDMKGPRYVGMYYENGYGGTVAVDYVKAAKYYQIGADTGDMTSQYLLGSLYERGLGVKQSYDLAISWYSKSAERGDLPASSGMIALGKLYETGKGVTKNLDTAQAWYEKADKAGNKDAKALLENLKK